MRKIRNAAITAAMSATGTEIPTAIATVLVFSGGWVSSVGTAEGDDEGVGVGDALMMEEVAAGVAGTLLDTATEVDSADDVGDADDNVEEDTSEQGRSTLAQQGVAIKRTGCK
jgi:hypothetical protein